ncbi:MAG: transposase [Candidatus Aegiribacteria sp.]|nr:transposase [Candidatus Aegiribacteria sp.]
MKTTFRVDEPGTFHHVISRAIDGKNIFSLPENQKDFISRLEKLAKQEHLKVYAWVLMSNHFHLLVEPVNISLSRSMQKLLTGFAMHYNKKSDRQGHVFQGRFRSILVEKESYFLELVRYIHLNPLRAGMVKDLNELNHYYSSGHVHITGVCNYPWQETDLLESEFSIRGNTWISGYLDFLSDGFNSNIKDMDIGSYFINREGLKAAECEKDAPQKRSVRISGSIEFARKIYKQLYDIRKMKIRNRNKEHRNIEAIIHAASEISRIPISTLRKPRGPRKATRIRRIIVKLLINEIGISQADTGRYLGLSDTAVSHLYKDTLDPQSLIVENAIKQSIEV